MKSNLFEMTHSFIDIVQHLHTIFVTKYNNKYTLLKRNIVIFPEGDMANCIICKNVQEKTKIHLQMSSEK